MAVEPPVENTTQTLETVLSNGNIRTLFQPIVTFAGTVPKIHGLEALTRGPLDSPLESAIDLFNAAENHNRLYELERLARLQAIERVGKQFENYELFLNLDPNVIYDSSFSGGNTIEYLNQHGLNQDDIVFEITERNQVKDNEAFKEAIRHYRQQGFDIAVDDVGSGFSNLDTIAQLRPDYIKIDMSLIRKLNQNRSHYQLVETIMEFGDKIDAKVVAEGIETEKELRTLLSMGLGYGQGFLLSEPSERPSAPNKTVKTIHMNCLTNSQTDEAPLLEELARPRTVFEADTLTRDAYDYLENNPNERSLVVTQDERLAGLLMRDQLHQKLSGKLGQSLYWERPISKIMNTNPIVLPKGTVLNQASEIVLERRDEDLNDEILVVDPDTDDFLGNVTVRQLLERITKFKTERAKRSNPLTGLPGNVDIRTNIQNKLNRDQKFALIYIDLDHFKAFNDYYGFERGDQALILLKKILKHALKIQGDSHNFLGHVGGDDFVAITEPQHAEPFCKSVINQFDEHIRELYEPKDLKEGIIKTKNRQGETQTFNLMTVSMAVVDNTNRSFDSHLKMSEVAAELKQHAKRNRSDHTYEIDRRAD